MQEFESEEIENNSLVQRLWNHPLIKRVRGVNLTEVPITQETTVPNAEPIVAATKTSTLVCSACGGR